MKPLLAEVVTFAGMTLEASSFFTMLGTWASAIAIMVGAYVAWRAITEGNRDKRNDRSVAALHIILSSRFKKLTLKLFPFGNPDDNRVYQYDSWHICWSLNYEVRAVNVYTGKVLLPLHSGKFTEMLVELINMLEEIRTLLHYNLVEKEIILESTSLVVMNIYYIVWPLLAEIEDDTGNDYNDFRRLAEKCQAFLKEHKPSTDARYLSIDTSSRKR